ncbi:hypothetical protein D3C72_2146880 [compost metagenome]
MVKFAAVRIGVGMGIEMHQRHFTEMLGMRAQQRQGHKMIATEREHTFTGSQQLLGMRLQFFAHLTRITEGINQIATVHHVQTFAHVEIPREAIMLPGQVRRHLTNGRRAMATTGTA